MCRATSPIIQAVGNANACFHGSAPNTAARLSLTETLHNIHKHKQWHSTLSHMPAANSKCNCISYDMHHKIDKEHILHASIQYVAHIHRKTVTSTSMLSLVNYLGASLGIGAVVGRHFQSFFLTNIWEHFTENCTERPATKRQTKGYQIQTYQ